MTAVQNLDSEILQNENMRLRHEVVQCNEKITYLEEQLNWFKRQIFGQRSERDISHVNPNQLELSGFESLQEGEQEAKNVAAHSRRKPENKSKESIVLPKDLPVETVIIDIPEEQKICPETGIPLVRIGEEITYRIAHKPGSFYLKEIIRPKYAYPKQEEKGIFTAELPESLLTRCRADESFLAFILTKKFGTRSRG